MPRKVMEDIPAMNRNSILVDLPTFSFFYPPGADAFSELDHFCQGSVI
jgi:hypothetical protein